MVDISQQFAGMELADFSRYLHSLSQEPELTIIVEWTGVVRARALKAFLQNVPNGQKRSASIIATEAQKNLERNVFTSGVQWIEAKCNV